MGLCCSTSQSAGSLDHNEAPATAVEEQADRVAAIPQCPTPLHMPAAARHAAEPAAKTGLSQTSAEAAAEAAAAADPLDNLVAADTAFNVAKPLADVLPSFWSREGSPDGALIEGEVEIYASPAGSSPGRYCQS
jgi:hypothetical protein